MLKRAITWIRGALSADDAAVDQAYEGLSNYITAGAEERGYVARCPCGKVPDSLHVTPGDTYRWRHVSCPCGEWFIEARVAARRDDKDAYGRVRTDKGIYADCVRAWNDAPRWWEDPFLEGRE